MAQVVVVVVVVAAKRKGVVQLETERQVVNEGHQNRYPPCRLEYRSHTIILETRPG